MSFNFTKKKLKINKSVLRDFLSLEKNRDCGQLCEKNRDCETHITAKKRDCKTREIQQKFCKTYGF